MAKLSLKTPLARSASIKFHSIRNISSPEDLAAGRTVYSGQLPITAIVDLPSHLATTEEFVRVIDRVVPGASSLVTVNGPAIPSNIPPQPNYISALFPDWSVTTLEEGVRQTIEFYRKK